MSYEINRTNDQLEYRDLVKHAILRVTSLGIHDLDEIISELGSPDPRLVSELFYEVEAEVINKSDTYEIHADEGKARRESSDLLLQLPAPNPMTSQWWFTLDSVEYVARKVWSFSRGGNCAFLGSPTAGYYFANWTGKQVCVLDIDKHVIHAVNSPERLHAELYDARDEISPAHIGKYNVVFADPPWYLDYTFLFINRARELINKNGYVLCAMPSLLTRPGIIAERTYLLEKLIQCNFEVISLETNSLEYRVPDFEMAAYSDIREFTSRNWRKGDLLVLRCSPSTSKIVETEIPTNGVMVFAKNPRKLRLFLSPSFGFPDQTEHVRVLEEFEKTVSTRGFDKNVISLWSTDKKACAIKHAAYAEQILRNWELNLDRNSAAKLADQMGIGGIETFQQLDSLFKLYEDSIQITDRRSTEKINELRTNALGRLATFVGHRQHAQSDDGFRLPFQRDRDRVLWSNSLKRLSNKTQLFPVGRDDLVRRRLSHTIEVMQLASTIAVSFGLDRDLTEAGALAHDIGHTPFGHAGEFALNGILDEIDNSLGGFTHYEHGLDVVTWLEDVYRSEGSDEQYGLNLTHEVKECIIKHCYHRDDVDFGQTRLISRTKHKSINDDSCHLEGQAVRIADKLSYFISDIEDGIRLGAITFNDLMLCRFFHRPPIDMKPSQKETLHERFVSQRRSMLKVLMEDIIENSDRNLSRLKDLNAVRKQRSYSIDFSRPIAIEFSEIWQKLQSGRLHKHPTVQKVNNRSSQIVRDLFLVCAVSPSVISETVRLSHDGLRDTEYYKAYRDRAKGETIGIPKRLLAKFAFEHTIGQKLAGAGDHWKVGVYDVILAKDYVASLTDAAAEQEHASLCRLV